MNNPEEIQRLLDIKKRARMLKIAIETGTATYRGVEDIHFILTGEMLANIPPLDSTQYPVLVELKD